MNKAKFKRLIKKLSTLNELPDYEIVSDTENDKVIFKNCLLDPIETDLLCKCEKSKREFYKLKNSF